MSRRHPFGWDLPPGVTHRHIDEAAGAYDNPEDWQSCPECGGTGGQEVITGIGINADYRFDECKTCKGTGLRPEHRNDDRP